jgi:hypothetical protein
MKHKPFIITKRHNFVLAPIGLHLARFFGLVDLGTQFLFDEWIPRILCYWELCEEKMDDGRPFIVQQEYTNTLGRGAELKEHIEGWCGELKPHELEGFNLSARIGEAALINVKHRTSSAGNERCEIIAINPVQRGTVIPPQVNADIVYRITDGEDDAFKSLSSYWQGKIRESAEFSGRHSTKAEIIERNSRQASENAFAGQETDEADDDDEESGESDDVFDLDSYTDEQLRDPIVVIEIREIIDNLPVSNGEKFNQLRYLNQLVQRARAKERAGY